MGYKQAEIPGTAQLLIDALDERSPEVRAWAAWKLGELRYLEAGPRLVTTLDDRSPGVRAYSASALGKLKYREAGPRLIAALNDPSPEVREWSAYALGNLKYREAGPRLIAALDDPSKDVRAWSAWALGNLKFRDAGPRLIAALNDRSVEVREWSAWALGDIRFYESQSALRRAMDMEDNSDVRGVLGGALKKLKGEATRVHVTQRREALQPPETTDPTLQNLTRQLEELELKGDQQQIVEMRAAIQKHDPAYYISYMDWVKRKSRIVAGIEQGQDPFFN